MSIFTEVLSVPGFPQMSVQQKAEVYLTAKRRWEERELAESQAAERESDAEEEQTE